MRSHPRRLRYGLEIGLGLGLALLVGWLVLGLDERRPASARARERVQADADRDSPLGPEARNERRLPGRGVVSARVPAKPESGALALDGPKPGAVDPGTRRPRPGRLTLQVPPAGSLRVEVLDSAGEPVHSGAWVYVTRNSRAPSCSALKVSEGWAELPRIELGGELELHAAFECARGGDVKARIQAPQRDGEVVQTTLRLTPGWPLVALRVVGVDGQALGNADLRLKLTQAPLSPQYVSLRTDSQGRASFVHFGKHRPEFPRALEAWIEATPLLCARLDLGFELELVRPTDLGDVVLAEGASVLLASGIVRDERGLLAGALALLGSQDSVASLRQTTTNARGAFEFRGLRTGEPLTLTAGAPGRSKMPKPVVVQPGTRGLVFELIESDARLHAPTPRLGDWSHD